MKKVLFRICAVAVFGLALTACGGHKDGDQNQDNNQPASVTTDSIANKHSEADEKEEHKEHTPKKEEPNEHKSTVPEEKGTPVIKDTAVLQEKPKDASTMGSTPTKHHVKPGGVQGTK